MGDGGALLADGELRVVVEEYSRLRRMLEQVAAIRLSLDRVETLLVILTVQVSVALTVCFEKLGQDPASSRVSNVAIVSAIAAHHLL